MNLHRIAALLAVLVLGLFAIPVTAHNQQPPCGVSSYGLVSNHPKPCPSPTATPQTSPTPTPQQPTPTPTPFCASTGNFCPGTQVTPTPTPQQPTPTPPAATPEPSPESTPTHPTVTLPPTDAGSGPSLPGGANGAVLAFFGLLAVAGVLVLVVYPRKDRGR